VISPTPGDGRHEGGLFVNETWGPVLSIACYCYGMDVLVHACEEWRRSDTHIHIPHIHVYVCVCLDQYGGRSCTIRAQPYNRRRFLDPLFVDSIYVSFFLFYVYLLSDNSECFR
jgi:hypothetical protein